MSLPNLCENFNMLLTGSDYNKIIQMTRQIVEKETRKVFILRDPKNFPWVTKDWDSWVHNEKKTFKLMNYFPDHEIKNTLIVIDASMLNSILDDYNLQWVFEHRHHCNVSFVILCPYLDYIPSFMHSLWDFMGVFKAYMPRELSLIKEICGDLTVHPKKNYWVDFKAGTSTLEPTGGWFW